jgi:hypothetical protein
MVNCTEKYYLFFFRSLSKRESNENFICFYETSNVMAVQLLNMERCVNYNDTHKPRGYNNIHSHKHETYHKSHIAYPGLENNFFIENSPQLSV